MRLGRAGVFMSVALALAALVSACDDGGGGRELEVVQKDDACTPATFDAKPGEKITFELVNQGSKDKEFEGTDGTKLEEVLVPAGKTRKTNWTAPKNPGTAKFKCYLPGGPTTIVTVEVR
jgi:plastocyanin